MKLPAWSFPDFPFDHVRAQKQFRAEIWARFFLGADLALAAHCQKKSVSSCAFASWIRNCCARRRAFSDSRLPGLLPFFLFLSYSRFEKISSKTRNKRDNKTFVLKRTTRCLEEGRKAEEKTRQKEKQNKKLNKTN